jgi:hypothetical protein
VNNVIAEYLGHQFDLTLTEKSDSYYIGFLKWDDKNSDRLRKAEKDNDSWYLDEDGNRLADNLLFEKSPWSIIEDGIIKKAVLRFHDYNTGEVRFATEPWPWRQSLLRLQRM